MPARQRTSEGGKKQYVVLSDGVTVEYVPHRTEAGLKAGHVGRATRGQIITLDTDAVDMDKIDRLVRLKGLAEYVEGETYAATTARVAVDAAGAEPDPVAAPVVAEQQFAQPVQSGFTGHDDDEEADTSEEE